MPLQHTEKQKALYQWLISFPEQSLSRLTLINTAASSASHVLLAITFGLYDSNIRRLNRLIIQLLLTRMRAQRTGNALHLEIVQTKLTDLHLAIDWATGTLPVFCVDEIDRPSCNKLSRNQAA